MARARPDDERVQLFGQLLNATLRLERRLGQDLEDACDLPHPWFEVLLRLVRAPGRRITIGDLGRQVLLTSGGITRLVDRMATAGLVARRPCASDRRVQYVQPTSEGVRRLRAALAVQAANVEEHLTGHLTDAEVATLSRLLDKITPPDC